MVGHTFKLEIEPSDIIENVAEKIRGRIRHSCIPAALHLRWEGAGAPPLVEVLQRPTRQHSTPYPTIKGNPDTLGRNLPSGLAFSTGQEAFQRMDQ